MIFFVYFLPVSLIYTAAWVTVPYPILNKPITAIIDLTVVYRRRSFHQLSCRMTLTLFSWRSRWLPHSFEDHRMKCRFLSPSCQLSVERVQRHEELFCLASFLWGSDLSLSQSKSTARALKPHKADIVMNWGRINSGMGRFPSSWLKSMAVDDIISLRCALVQRGLTPISLNWTNSVFYSVFIKYALKYNTVVVSCLWFSCFCTSITEVNSLYCVATEIPFAP